MKEIIDSLNDKEKKTLVLLCLLVAAAFLFLLLISLPQKADFSQTLSSLAAKEKEYELPSRKSFERKEEWLRWQEAQRDLEELKAKYFYDDKKGFGRLRLDLQQLFDEAGIHVPRIKYDYSELKKEKARKVMISFNLRVSYLSLKRFVNAVEAFPKFLFVEEVDFLEVDSSRETLELKVVLTAYYET